MQNPRRCHKTQVLARMCIIMYQRIEAVRLSLISSMKLANKVVLRELAVKYRELHKLRWR